MKHTSKTGWTCWHLQANIWLRGTDSPIFMEATEETVPASLELHPHCPADSHIPRPYSQLEMLNPPKGTF